MEVGGEVTSVDLSGLISQTEHNVVVVPIYTEGLGTPMLGSAVTGQCCVLHRLEVVTFSNQLCLCAIRRGSGPQKPAGL